MRMRGHTPLQPLRLSKIMESSLEDGQNRDCLCTPENVLRTFVDAKLSCNLRVLGSQLGLDPSDLNDIERDTYDQGLTKLLIKCSRRRTEPNFTWTWIASTLRKPALKEYSVAAYIDRQYARRNSSISSSLSLSSSTSSTEPLLLSPIHTDSESEFSIPNAVNEIALFCDWKELGILLELTAEDIEMISLYDQREHHQRLVEIWFARDPDHSWEKLQWSIKEGRSRKPSYDSISSIPSTPTSPPDIELQLTGFDKRFGEMQYTACTELAEKQDSVVLIEKELETLPCNIFKENYEYVIKMIDQPKSFPNVRIFFQHLRFYCWNFFEYKVLEVLINKHCGEELKEKMRGYSSDIEKFKKRTTITHFITSKSGRCLVKKTEVPETFRKLTTKHGIDPDVCTLSDLDVFRLTVQEFLEHKLSHCAIQVYTIKHGSVIIKWIFPEELTNTLLELFDSEDGHKLMQLHMIDKLLIDGKTVPTLCLLGAMKAENWDKVKELLSNKDSDIDVNSSDQETDQTVLLYMAKSGNTEVVKLIIEREADIDITDKHQRTALIHASHEGHTNIVQLLLEKGARPNHQATGGWTALMLASYRGHVEVVELLLEYESDVNLTTEQGWTALQRVCLYNLTRYPKAKHKPSERRVEIARVLIDHGTDIMKVDRQGRTPLIAASDSGFADIVKLLVDKISELSDEARQKYLDYKKHFSWTALMSASEKGHPEVVKILIEAGASRNLPKEKDEVSALHIAVQNGHVEVVEALTHKMDKPDLNARDNYGMTPLILATKRRSEQLINVLIHAGVDVDAQSKDEDQMTALMFAVKVGSFDVVKLLVENSANLFAKNSRKETVFEMAKNSSKEIQDYLSEKCKQAEEQQSQRATVLP